MDSLRSLEPSNTPPATDGGGEISRDHVREGDDDYPAPLSTLEVIEPALTLYKTRVY